MAERTGDIPLASDDDVIDLIELEAVNVLVHCRHRFFREGLASLLSAEPRVRVVATVVTVDELERACAEHDADIALVDLVDAPEDDLHVALDLEHRIDGLRCVVLCNEPRMARDARRAGLRAVLTPQEGAKGVVHALTSDDVATSPSTVRDTSAVLTSREREVLEFIGEGCTTWEVSRHLGISRKTVENHKQRIFAKLDVQNQAHAVAVAVRRGLIAVDGDGPVTTGAR
jgi:DNA-binding NarL/FixJ family response regulator